MEEKKNEIRGGFRSFFGNRNVLKFFLFPNSNSKNSGFTLIELLVVIGIIGVLSAGVIIAIDPIKQINRANDKRRISDLKQIQAGLELYRSDNGFYPANAEVTCGASVTASIDGGTPVTYINKVPCDPKVSTASYLYVRTPGNSSSYTITACLEDLKDANGTGPLPAACSTAPLNRSYFYQVFSP